jgi:predicted ABC-type transport system involved in lysophospholipase L1 biosynthesis ATPase subunit
VRRDKIDSFSIFNLPTLFLENVSLPLHLRGWPRKRSSERARAAGPGTLSDAWTTYRTNSPAASASAWRSPSSDVYPPILLADEPTGNLDTHTALRS